MKKTILFIFVAMSILQMNAANCPMAHGWGSLELIRSLQKDEYSFNRGTGGPLLGGHGDALEEYYAQQAVRVEWERRDQKALEEQKQKQEQEQRIRDVLAVLNDVPLAERPSFIGSLLGSLGTMLSEGMRTPPDAFSQAERPEAPDSRPTSPIKVK